MVTPFISQVALTFGCDDLEGTVVFERVYHEAGAQTAMWLSYDQIITLIRGAGKEPVERDSLYQTVRTFEGYEPKPQAAPAPAEGPAPQGALFQIAHRPRGAARGQQQPVATAVDGAE
jgi:aminodeoxyfutalosine synthase